jgi:hypothetical protein
MLPGIFQMTLARDRRRPLFLIVSCLRDSARALL